MNIRIYIQKLLFLAITSFILNDLEAQQERQFTQFMYNKLIINPAFAGSNTATTISGIYRQQWIGFQGAPITQLISANIPLMEQRVGLGLNLSHSGIGISNMWSVSAQYAYRIPVGAGYLSGGLEGSLRYYTVNYNDPGLHSDIDLNADLAVLQDNVSKLVPNVGLGLYYADQSFFVGISAPRVLSSSIDFDEQLLVSREVLHLYLMAGYSIAIADEIFLTPQLIAKFAKNSPLSLDVNTMVDFGGRFNAGVSYRTGGIRNINGESIDVLAGFKIKSALYLGLSYDIQISQLSRFNSGSVELMMRYSLPTENKNIQNPRFF